MKKKYMLTILIGLISSFFFVTFGYATYTQDLTIDDISATIRPPLDVRVTNFYLEETTNDAFVDNLDFNYNAFFCDIIMPENSTITYTLEFTNYSNHSAYLIDIIGLPDNIKYEIDAGKEDKYSLKDLMVKHENDMKEITLTLSYKDGGYKSENETYHLNIGFYFESAYTVVFHSNHGKLPIEYQELEYIESTGTQYIDTKYLPNNLTEIESKFRYNKITDTSSPFGVREVNETIKQFLISTTSDRVLWIVNGLNNVSVTNVKPNIGEDYVVKVGPQSAYWNNNLIMNMTSSLASIEKLPMYLFGRNTAYGFSTPLDGRIYYFKIYENGELIKDFIPCYRNEDNVVGMYDLVENVFYKNEGTGDFKKGPVIENYNYQTILTGQNTALRKNSFTMPYSKFISWNTSKNGNGKKYADEENVYNIADNDEIINLYAQWQPFKLIVKLNANGGQGEMKDVEIPYMTSKLLTLNSYKKRGYDFGGWNTKSDGTGIKYDDGASIYNSNKTDGEVLNLYAQWKYKSLPLEYQAVEYLESNGLQYIDTGYYPNNLTNVECKFMYNQLLQTSSPFGVRVQDGTVKQFLMSSTAERVLWIVNGLNNEPIPNIKPTTGEIYTVKVTPTTAYWNETPILEMTKEIANIENYTMYMFGRNTTGGFQTPLNGKIYYLKIFENGELVKNFVPCYRKEDNVAGMYDMIEGVFYTNNGSGTFTVGKDFN